MRAYRVFVDYGVSFVVSAEEIEDKFLQIRFGILFNKEGSTRFIRTLNGDLINVDHIVRMVPCTEPEYERRMKA